VKSRDLRRLLSGGDRRSIARSDRVRALVEKNPELVEELAGLTEDDDWLVSQRAFDLLEKIAHDHVDWIEPHKRIFLGPGAASDKWEVRLQIVRALPLFSWPSKDLARAKAILLENVVYPQTFVKAWALDSLAAFALKDAHLIPIVQHHLEIFDRSESKALQARARKIRERLEGM
jgi:hypothetical protein